MWPRSTLSFFPRRPAPHAAVWHAHHPPLQIVQTMCGRAFCVLGDDEIVAAVAGPSSSAPSANHGRHRVAWRQRDAFGPIRNAGPTMVLPCVTAVEAGDDAGGPVTIAVQSMAWGFPRPPGDEKASAAPSHVPAALVINARAETALSTPMWARAMAARDGRCVLVVNGFYEWKRAPKGSRVASAPYYVSRADGIPLALAALSREPDNAATLSQVGLRRFAVLTTDPPSSLTFLHDRAPLLLPTPEAVRAWLHPRGGRITPAALAALEQPAAVVAWPLLTAVPVTRDVGKISYQGADCNVDVRSKKGSIASLFAAKAAAEKGGGQKRVKEEETGGATPAVSASPPAPARKKIKAEAREGGGGVEVKTVK